MVHLHCNGSSAPSLCICVDDFGLHGSIDQATIQLVEMGRVHAVTCLVGGSSIKHTRTPLARMVHLGVDVGVHLDFTEVPLMPQSCHSLQQLILRSYTNQLDSQQVRAEICAQLDSFEDLTGRRPAFIDGHQHVHQLPVIRDELMEELSRRFGTDASPWLRSTLTPVATAHVQSPSWRERIKPWVIENLGEHALRRMCGELGYKQNGHLLGVYDFEGGSSRYLQMLQIWLKVARHGDLLMCHPSVGPAAGDGLAAARKAEFDVLSGRDFNNLMGASALSLSSLTAIHSSETRNQVITTTG